MKLEQQVTSLEISNRLKELGVKQESIFCWTHWTHPEKWEVRESWMDKDEADFLHAFTVAELGEMLPAHYFTTKSAEKKNWWHCNKIVPFEEGKKGIITNTEADARGKMLIYLLENKLI